MTYEGLADDLVANVPDFRKRYEEHLADYDQVLPHVLLAELARYVISTYRESGSHTAGIGSIRPALEWLERGMASEDSRVPEAIVVSFLENLQKDEQYGPKLEPFLGPRLRAALAETRAT